MTSLSFPQGPQEAQDGGKSGFRVAEGKRAGSVGMSIQKDR
jgi:hypothetical protein